MGKTLRKLLRALVNRCEDGITFVDFKDAYRDQVDETEAEIKQWIKENLPEEYPIVESLIDERKIWMKGYNSYRTKTLKNMGIK